MFEFGCICDHVANVIKRFFSVRTTHASVHVYSAHYTVDKHEPVFSDLEPPPLARIALKLVYALLLDTVYVCNISYRCGNGA